MCGTCGCDGKTPGGMRKFRVQLRERELLRRNADLAEGNRGIFREARTLSLNLVSSPGSGKTSLLTRTLGLLQGRFPLGVIEGDQQTDLDAERIRATGVPVIQVNTGQGCHLDAPMIRRAWEGLAMDPGGVLLIENVGNLVCPAEFDLGESAKVAVLAVTEGEDKPLKYPELFQAAGLLLLNKVDLLPLLDFDLEYCLACIREVNPALKVIQTSATTGQGMEAWAAWIEAERARCA
nr:hydrogenase nickel incorporation protein HypB [uncultured Holophaga sp.]